MQGHLVLTIGRAGPSGARRLGASLAAKPLPQARETTGRELLLTCPHSPWQRGTNENANGLIREYLPQGMDRSRISDKQLSSVENSLDHRPRKILGFKTPFEGFCELKLNNVAGVVLQT